jgi:hypothetical protein
MTNTGDEAAPLGQRTAETQVERLRALAALAMVIASVAVGFIAGRASVWLVPFEAASTVGAGRQTAAVRAPEAEPELKAKRSAQPSDGKESKPPVPLPPVSGENGQKASPRPEAPSTNGAQPPSSAGASDQPRTNRSEGDPGNLTKEPIPPAAAKAVEPTVTPDANRTPVTPDANRAPQGFTLLNPGATNAAPNAPPEARDPSRSAPERPAAANMSSADAPGLEECERRYSSFRRSDGTYQPFGGGPRMRCPHLR